MRTLASFLASTSTARLMPIASMSSSRSSEPNTAPIRTYGPNRPIPASIGSLRLRVDADQARQRQQAERLLQRDRARPSMPRGRDVRRGFCFLSSPVRPAGRKARRDRAGR